ncbi:MAG: zinc ribbon domain-containing protein [Promethearchaeia archaeon]
MFCKKIVYLMTVLFMSVIFLNGIMLYIRADTYELDFKTEENFIWEISHHNETLIQNLITYEDYGSDYANLYVGLQNRWEITEIYPERENSYGESYWKVDYTLYIGENLRYSEADESNDYTSSIMAEPEALANDWFDRESFEFSIRILPVNTDEFLAGFYDNMPIENKTVYSVSGYKLIEDQRNTGHNDTTIITYNSKGLVQNYSVYFDGELAHQYLLIDDYANDNFFNPFLIFGIVFGGIVIFFIVAAVIVVAWRSSTKNYDDNKYANPYRSNSGDTSAANQQQAPPSQKPEKSPKPDNQESTPTSIEKSEPKVIGYCPLCGAKRESDAKFCPFCGNRF